MRDGNIGGLLSKEDMIGNRFYYHYDGSGNVVGMTDEQQNVVAEYTYDAWGTLLSSSGSEAGNNAYRFSTKEYFAETGLYNYGYRFYSPGMGRWINRDPLGEDGGLNLYAAICMRRWQTRQLIMVMNTATLILSSISLSLRMISTRSFRILVTKAIGQH